jgi:pimeloyl-ACP methyl ester carboxylesterase
VPGGRIVAEVSGIGSPVVLLHTGVADRRMWNVIVPALERHHTVVRFDLRGFGASPVSSVPFHHRDDLLAVLETARIDRAALVGASLGGIVALEFTVAHPDRVTALVLLASGLPGYSWSAEMTEHFEAEEAALANADIDQVIKLNLEMWVRGPYRAWTDRTREVAEKLRDQLRIIAVNQSSSEDLALPADPPVRSVIHRITAPTVVGVAESDPVDLPAISAQIAAAIPGARTVRFAETGHLIAMERPDATAKLILDFLATAGAH